MSDTESQQNPEEENKSLSPIDEKRRQFLLVSTWVLGGIGAMCALKPFISSWMPSAQTLANGAPLQIDLSQMRPGEQLIVEWRGKPIWIIRRTEEMLQHLQDHLSELRDPDSLVEQQPGYAQNIYRSIKPEYLVLVGLCTHLGCSPKYMPKPGALDTTWSGGFFCPCHGSTFDLAGRVFKGVPAPVNLEVPPYYFKSDHVIVIGDEN